MLNSTVSNQRLAVPTTRVPAQLGVQFGLEYIATGGPADRAILRKVVIFPSAGIRYPPANTPTYRSESTISAPDGVVRYTGWVFDDPWELVPGIWTIQLWDSDRELAEQHFTVVARRR
jgi:hypothetical protein